MSDRDTGPVPVVIRMSDDLYQQVKATADAEERSMASVMRRALRRYVEQMAVAS